MAFQGKKTRTLGVLGSTLFLWVSCRVSTIFRSALAAALGKRAGRRLSVRVKTIEAIKEVRRKFDMVDIAYQLLIRQGGKRRFLPA